MASIGKYSQTPRVPFYKNFRYCERKKLTKNRDTLWLLCIFDNRNFPKHQKGPLPYFFLQTKKFSTSFCDTPDYGSPKFSCPTNRQLQQREFFRYRNAVWQKVLTFFGGTLFWCTKASAPDLWAGSTLACCLLLLVSVNNFSRTKVVTSVVQFSSFSRICECHATFVI